jgi:hypothetical protein
MIPAFLYPIANDHGIGCDGTFDELRPAAWWSGRKTITLDGDFTAGRSVKDVLAPLSAEHQEK